MTDDVTRYYNRNTRSFLRFGRKSGSTGAIHRELRAPGVTTTAEALHYVHELIARQLIESDVCSPLRHESADRAGAGAASTAKGGAPSPGPADHAAARDNAVSPPLVLDLGCGVGGSIAWLSQRLAARFAGLTLSDVQVRTGRERLVELLDEEARRRVTIGGGDFTNRHDLRALVAAATADATTTTDTAATPNTTINANAAAPADAAYMIESYNHGPDVDTTLSTLAEFIRPEGVLIIVDDLPTDQLLEIVSDAATTARSTATPREPGGQDRSRASAPQPHRRRSNRVGGNNRHRRLRWWTREFRRGWHVHTFESARGLIRAAKNHGFDLVTDIDLTAYVVRGRLRDVLIRGIAGPAAVAGVESEWWDNIRGGNALQQLERTGYMEYRLLAFRRR